MSRPETPSYVVEEFAPDDTYPAGGNTWNSNPTKVAPPGANSVGYAPNQGNAAQYHNWVGFHSLDAGRNAKSTLLDLFDYLAQIPALNWTAISFTAIGNSNEIRFCARTGMWLKGGGNGGVNVMVRTHDPTVWPSSNEVGAGAQVASSGYFDVAPDGTIVQVADVGNVSEYDGTTWTKHVGAMSAFVTSPHIAFDVASGNWIVAGTNGAGNALQVFTSPDRITWTAQTPPTVAAAVNTNSRHALVSNGSTIVWRIHHYNGGPYDHVAYTASSDGGVTWSTPDEYADTFTAATSQFLPPTWNGTTWVDVNATTAGTTVRSSTDGATWTTVATLTTFHAMHVVSMGAMLVAMNTSGDLILSTNAGVDWKLTDVRLPGVDRIVAGTLRMVAWGTSTTGCVSFGTGPGAGAVT